MQIQKIPIPLQSLTRRSILQQQCNARMAESVDALVSNTSGAIRAGSIPAPGTRNPRRVISTRVFQFSFPTFSPHLPNFAQSFSLFYPPIHKKEPFRGRQAYFTCCYPQNTGISWTAVRQQGFKIWKGWQFSITSHEQERQLITK